MLLHKKNDTECVNNLASDAKHLEVKKELRVKMEQMLHEEDDPRALGEAWIFDTYQYTGRRAHSYDSWLANQRL